MSITNEQPVATGSSDSHNLAANILASRVASLQTAHPWMAPQVSTTLALSDTSNSELTQISDSLKRAAQQTWDGISHFFADPVLEKQPTLSMATRRYLTGSLGAWPVSDAHLVHIQGELQKRGFATDLPTDGVWTAGWQAALQQHTQAEYDRQSSGDKPGSVSSGGFLHSVLGSISPSGIASGIVGFVKSIPGDVREAMAVLGSGLAALPHEIAGESHDITKHRVSQDHAAIMNFFGAHESSDTVEKAPLSENVNRAVNTAGTVFLLSGLGKSAGAISDSFLKNRAEGLGTRITTHEALRGPGVVAKSLLRPVGTRIATGTVIGGAAGGAQAALRGSDIGTGIGQGIAAGALTGALLPQRVFENLPVLGRTGPVLGKLSDAEGLYYKTRTRLATPYQFGAVRLAGTANSQAQAFSLKAHGVAYIEHLIGGNTGNIQQAIDNSAPLNGINDSLRNKLSFTSAGQHFAPDLDYLMYFLHGPVTPGAVGTTSHALKRDSDALLAGLQNNNVIQQVEQGTGRDYHDLLALAGGDPNRLNLWISNKTKQAASHQHAEEVYNSLRASLGDQAPNVDSASRLELLRSEAAKVWNDPAAMRTAVARMQGSGENYLSTFIKDELTRAQASPTNHLKHELSVYLDAGETLTHSVLPHADRFLLTPHEKTFMPKGMDPQYYQPELQGEHIKVMTRGEVGAGNIGLARSTTLTSQQALRDVRTFATELEAASTNPQELDAWYVKAHDYLFHNYGLDARKLQLFTGTPEKTLNLLTDRAKTLAADVYLTHDAPADLHKAFEKIEGHGYKVVVGSDIGHAYRSDLPPIADLGQAISTARKVVSNIGLNPQRFSRIDYGVDRRLRITTALNKAVDEGRITLPPFYTVKTLLDDLQDDAIVGKQLPWAGNLAFAASRRAHKGTVEELIKLGKAETPAQAEALLKTQLASVGGLRDLRLQDIRRVLTRTENVPWVNAARNEDGLLAETNDIPLMSQQHADEVFKAIQQGYSQTPTHMLGLQKVEDFTRYLPFKIATKAHVPSTKATLALMNLPNRLAQLRDTYRFNLSPFFDLRRVAKTNVKMAANGVVPTLTPVKELIRQGNWDTAHASLDRLLGTSNPKYKYLDEADRYLDSTGVFGLYNPRHFEAYYVAQKQAAGANDKEIHDGLVRVFHYGTDGVEGRTAIERTINTVFFPFSFEKTVVRNVGGYLLDKPAQALILSNSLDAYRDFSNHHKDNPLALDWIEKHTPLMTEVLRLNAFAHGLSAGELGGVNRPILNAFMPQSWETDKDTTKTLARFIPAVADLKRIVGEGTQQGKIVRQAVANGVYAIENGSSNHLLNQRPIAESEVSQRNDARIFRAELVDAFKNVLDYNDSVGSDEEKYHFGLGNNIPDDLKGTVISRTNIGYIVKQRFPVYDPLAGAAYAIKNKHDAELYVRRSGNPQYADFYAKAQTVIAHLNSDEYPTEQAAAVQGAFRQAAIDYAQKDASFLKFYNRTFASSFGPLQAIR